MKDKINEILVNVLKELNIELKDSITIEKPSNKELGDFSTNIALKLAKANGVVPMELASKIAEKLTAPFISKIEIKSPGFINFFVDKNYLFENIKTVITSGKDYGRVNIGNGQQINVEFVSANPTGTLHLGNARGGAYGDNIARILSFANYKVNKEYYVNDAGNQVENLGLSLQARYLEVCGLEGKIPEDGYFGEDIKELANELYQEYSNRLINEKTEFFKNYGIEKMLNRIKEDLKSYRVIHDKFTSEKEITAQNYIDEILKLYKEKDYTYEKDGATWFKGTLFGAPRDFVLIKSDGHYTYLLPDIAHHKDTLKTNYVKLINVLGADHHGYVPAITSTVQALGYPKELMDIKLLQLVRLVKDGKEVRMSKRTGNSITLKDLVTEVGINATRYFFAARNLDSQMDFDIEVAKKESNENPIYYICYAYARICSILKEYKTLPEVQNFEAIKNEEAYNVLEQVYNFSQVVTDAATKELPHIIANYCYELANLFHIYYSKHRIISDDETETNEQLNLITAVKITLENALNLIGIIPPEKM